MLALSLGFASCTGCSDGGTGVEGDTIDTALLKPAEPDTLRTVRGEVLDGASSSVMVRDLEKGDTLEFEYSYLPEENRFRSEVGDTIDITYVIEKDSVVLIKHAE